MSRRRRRPSEKKPLYLYTRPCGLRLFVVRTCIRITLRALLDSSLRAAFVLSVYDLSSHRQTQNVVIIILTSRYFKGLLLFKGNPQKKNSVLFSFVKQHIRLLVWDFHNLAVLTIDIRSIEEKK